MFAIIFVPNSVFSKNMVFSKILSLIKNFENIGHMCDCEKCLSRTVLFRKHETFSKSCEMIDLENLQLSMFLIKFLSKTYLVISRNSFSLHVCDKSSFAIFRNQTYVFYVCENLKHC